MFARLEYTILTTPIRHVAAKPSIAIHLLESRLHAISAWKVLADPRSLAATDGIEHDPLPTTQWWIVSKKSCVCFFLFLWLLRCFNSPGYLQLPYVFRQRYLDLPSRWVSPFGHSRVKGCLEPHRDFSHPATSFFGFLCRGIHRLLLSVRNRLNS